MIVDKSFVTEKDLKYIENSGYKIHCDDFDFTDIIVNKPWGREYLLFENDDIAIWILFIKPRSQTSMHCHVFKDTSLISLSGIVICDTLDSKHNLAELDGIYLGKGVFHQTCNNEEEESIVMEIETPVNKFDLLRLNDDYGRVLDPYEGLESYELKHNVTCKDIQKHEFVGEYNNVMMKMGVAKNKDDLLDIYAKNDNSVLAVLLNRNLWFSSGEKAINVGQLFVLDKEELEKYFINHNFIYLILNKRV